MRRHTFEARRNFARREDRSRHKTIKMHRCVASGRWWAFTYSYRRHSGCHSCNSACHVQYLFRENAIANSLKRPLTIFAPDSKHVVHALRVFAKLKAHLPRFTAHSGVLFLGPKAKPEMGSSLRVSNQADPVLEPNFWPQNEGQKLCDF